MATDPGQRAKEASDAAIPFFSDRSGPGGTGQFLELIGARGPDPDKAAASFRESRALTFEATVDELNFLPSIFLERGAAAARAVGRIVVQQGRDHRDVFRADGWKGTGFLVGKDLLLTNHHVLNSIEVCQAATFQLNYRNRLDGTADKFDEYKLRPGDLFVTSKAFGGLDYTFVAIGPEAAERYGFIPVERRAYVFDEDPERRVANIIQHPNGRYQEIVIHDNTIAADTGLCLQYLTDTEGGSSGSPILDNRWRLVGLHHASARNQAGLSDPRTGKVPALLNEGIKMAAIASDLESRIHTEGPQGPAARVLECFAGINSAVGYFGTLGRGSDKSGLEALVETYRGTDQDLDIGAWNIEGFAERWEVKVKRVAALIADFNLDIWALVDSSPAAADALAGLLKDEYGLDYGVGHSEPGAASDHRTTSMIWNKATIEGGRIEWDEEVRPWFDVSSGSFAADALEARQGRIFERYPGLFRFRATGTDYEFHAVPLHLKAKEEGALRREMGSRILTAAIAAMSMRSGGERDWILLGDMNAETAARNLEALRPRGLIALSAEDELAGTFTYLKNPRRSMIDHVYVSPYLAKHYGPPGYFTVAADKAFPGYIKDISDHRPIVTRLALRKITKDETIAALPDSLQAALEELYPAAAAEA
jgi:V8-like Glu-specific endopeptidase/endonuclease/exonuclease/phosphatase family metal-dependent hydrolase